MNIEKELNEKQIIAVKTNAQHVRIVAGAGSGKTRVLTYRIAYLIDYQDVEPFEILAFTFTNKVANEMRDRVFKLIPEKSQGLTIRTFHSFAAYFLRKEIYNLDFPTNFTILDEEDQLTLLKDVAASLGYKKKDPIIKLSQSYISKQKLREKYPEDCKATNPNFPQEKECIDIYTRYEEEKNKMFVLDFDDLLLKTNQILRDFPYVRNKWQRSFSHILIDEFQDTNDVEFKMVRLLIRDDSNLYVVGDPDQTIYTWRGANQNIILKLNENFPDIETIILDRNYRSTKIILDSANKLISNNKQRIKKDLYTENVGGNPISVYTGLSTQLEANYVAKEIEQLTSKNGYQLKDIAILYRSNYVTVDFEKALIAHRIKYAIYGGLKFFERREIKDVLAYFHLIVNVKDDVSFLRICNVPRRGIGETSIELLKQEAKSKNASLYEYIGMIDVKESLVSTKVLNSLKAMVERIDETRDDLSKDEETYSKTLEELILGVGYFDYLSKEDDGDERIENVKSLFEDIRHFAKNNPDSTFDEYLQNVTLNSAQDDVDDGNHVALMTVHTAKGLEFPIVFIVKFNESIFPHVRSLTEGGYEALEEERRLAYVAMTRAKERLYMTFSNDYSYVVGTSLQCSRFLIESGNGAKTVNEYNPYRSNKRSKDFYFDDGKHISPFENQTPPPSTPVFEDTPTNGITSWQVGDIVIHTRLGEGVVIALEGDDIIKVDFKDHGIKSILGSHPAVKKGGHQA